MIHRLQVPGPISDVEEVRVLQWHGEPGRAFAPDELIVEVETHKAVVELRAQQPCVLRAILCAEGDWARIGATLALASDDPDEPLPDAPDDAPPLAVAFEVT